MIDQDTLAALLEKRRAKHHTLARLAEHLRGLKFPPPITGKWAAESADAIECFLDGNEKSLDIAFRLNPKRGRPDDPARREYIARQAIALRIDGATWRAIADALKAEKIFVDPSDVKHYVDEFRSEILKVETLIEAHAEDVIRDFANGK